MQGALISDRYRLVRLIGRGGMGSVWLAEHTALKTQVAVKLIDSELGKLPQPRARFLREAQLAARVKSVHVVQVYDYGVTPEGQPFIAMEYLVGESLRDRMDRGPLSVGETARLVSHLSRALTRAHEAGLVHRDLKPENVMLAKEGDDEIAKVLDFGVAKASDSLSDSSIDPTRTGALLGTPFYMSPEQAQGLKTVDHRTDLWAMGVLVFECLTGHHQFSAEALGPLIGKILAAPITVPSLAAPDARLSPEIDAWVLRALERDPAKRFASAKELAEAFDIASGTTSSIDRDRLPRDASSSPSLRDPLRDAVAHAPTVDTSQSGLGGTLLMEGAPRASTRQAPVPVAPVPVAPVPVAPVAPAWTGGASPVGGVAPAPVSGAGLPAAPSRSALPWIVAVALLGLVVVALVVVLVTRR